MSVKDATSTAYHKLSIGYLGSTSANIRQIHKFWKHQKHSQINQHILSSPQMLIFHVNFINDSQNASLNTLRFGVKLHIFLSSGKHLLYLVALHFITEDLYHNWSQQVHMYSGPDLILQFVKEVYHSLWIGFVCFWF